MYMLFRKTWIYLIGIFYITINDHSIRFHNICLFRNNFYYDQNYWEFCAQLNQSSFSTPTLDNLTGIPEGNNTSSNSTSTSDSSGESGED